MTIVTTAPRTTAAGHAYVVPVVREVAPPQSAPTNQGVW